MEGGHFGGKIALFSLVLLLSFSILSAQTTCPIVMPTKISVSSDPVGSGSPIQTSIYLYYEQLVTVPGQSIPQLEVKPVEGGQVFVIQNDDGNMSPCRAITGADGKAVVQLTPAFGSYECRAIRAVFCSNLTSRKDIEWCTGIDLGSDAGGVGLCSGSGGGYKPNDDLSASQASTQVCPDTATFVNTPFCAMVGLIFGLLIAAAFFQGRNPLAAFDFGAARYLKPSKGGGYIPMTQNINVNPVAIGTALVQTADQIASGSNKGQTEYQKQDGKWTADKEEAAKSWGDAKQTPPSGKLAVREVPMYATRQYQYKKADGTFGKKEEAEASWRDAGKDPAAHMTREFAGFGSTTNKNDPDIVKGHQTRSWLGLKKGGDEPVSYSEYRGWQAMDSQNTLTGSGAPIISGFFSEQGRKFKEKTSGWLGIDPSKGFFHNAADHMVGLAVRMTPAMIAAAVAKRQNRQEKLVDFKVLGTRVKFLSMDAGAADVIRTSFREETLRTLVSFGTSQIVLWLKHADSQDIGHALGLSKDEAAQVADAQKKIEEKKAQIAKLEERMLNTPEEYKETAQQIADAKKAGALKSEVRKLERQLVNITRNLRGTFTTIDGRIAAANASIADIEHSILLLDRNYANATEEQKTQLGEQKDALLKAKNEMEGQRAQLVAAKKETLDLALEIPKVIAAKQEEISAIKARGANATPDEKAQLKELEEDVSVLTQKVLPGIYTYVRADMERNNAEVARIEQTLTDQNRANVEGLKEVVAAQEIYVSQMREEKTTAALAKAWEKEFGATVQKVVKIDAKIADANCVLEQNLVPEAHRTEVQQSIKNMEQERTRLISEADVNRQTANSLQAIDNQLSANFSLLQNYDLASSEGISQAATILAENHNLMEQKNEIVGQIAQSLSQPSQARLAEIERGIKNAAGQLQAATAEQRMDAQIKIVNLQAEKISLQRETMSAAEYGLVQLNHELGQSGRMTPTGDLIAPPTGLHAELEKVVQKTQEPIRQEAARVDVLNAQVQAAFAQNPQEYASNAAAEFAVSSTAPPQQNEFGKPLAYTEPAAILDTIQFTPQAQPKVNLLVSEYNTLKQSDTQAARQRMEQIVNVQLKEIVADPANVAGIAPASSMPASLAPNTEFRVCRNEAAVSISNKAVEAATNIAVATGIQPEESVVLTPYAQQKVGEIHSQMQTAQPDEQQQYREQIKLVVLDPNNVVGLQRPENLSGKSQEAIEAYQEKYHEYAQHASNTAASLASGNYSSIVTGAMQPESLLVLSPEAGRQVAILREEQRNTENADRKEAISYQISTLLQSPGIVVGLKPPEEAPAEAMADPDFRRRYNTVYQGQQQAQKMVGMDEKEREAEKEMVLSELSESQGNLSNMAWHASTTRTTLMQNVLQQTNSVVSMMIQSHTGNFGYKSDKGWAAVLGPFAGSMAIDPFLQQQNSAMDMYMRMRAMGLK